MNIDSADTAWVLVSAALVLLMTPGLALFYGGMVHSKNVLSTFMHSFVAMGILTIQWVAFGYSLAFGTSHGGFIGGLDFAFLNGVGLGAVSETVKIPQLLFMAFQMMFAVITPALISGAFAERVKFSTYIVFSLLWATLVYDPVCHWVWNADGWLLKRGALDFAGGTVVHMTAGFSALVFAIVIGKRKRPAPPHNLTMTLLGAGLLWFGWFGFNAGSALASGGLAVLALVNTHIAAAVGAVAWAIVEYLKQGKATALGIASGLVAGLVGITPAAGFVSPMSAAVIGGAAGVVCFGGVMLKSKLGYDDALDAFGVHGVGGLLGALLTGVLASSGWNSAVTVQGAELVVEQAIGAGVTAIYSIAVTFVLLKVLDATMGLRVEEDVEREGLDVNLHGEQGYILGGEGGMLAGEEGAAHGHAVAHSAPVVSAT
ncbi:MAG TPA: ammonium transporter [Polyangiales bacterium]|nr:ammonium transporter [Polyangiales bacterium]